MGVQKRENTPLNTHNETNPTYQRAENPCKSSIFAKRIRLIVSIPVVSKLSTLFGPSDRIRTCGILLPKQARYQLRYTRLFSFFRLDVFSQIKRDTTFATPGYLLVTIIARNSCDSKFFPVCGHLCGQSGFPA